MANRVEYFERNGVEYRREHTDAHSAVERVVDDELRLTSEYRDAHKAPEAAAAVPAAKAPAVKAPAAKAKAVKRKGKR